MTKPISSILLSFIAILALVPLPGRAVSVSREGTNGTFCTALSDGDLPLMRKIEEKSEALKQYEKEWSDKLNEKRDTRDAALGEARSKADERRLEWYLRIEAMADTKTEEKAVLVFRDTVEEAIDARRDAVDSALLEFRTGVQSVLNDRQATIERLRAASLTSVTSVIEEARAECERGNAADAIRKKLRESLKADQEQTARGIAAEKRKNEAVKKLAAEKNLALKKAFEQFNAAIEAAKAKLKRSFDEKTDAS